MDMSRPIVDLTNLREIIGNDKALEKNLIELFLSSSKDNIGYLQRNCLDKVDAEWKMNAHSLKGATRNIGASTLAELCAKAQELHSAPAATKKEIYLQIQSEYERVKDYLMKII